jgi:flagellar hook assembly protein FlgD
LANALLITFLGGGVTLTDNLLRPRTGARTKIDTTIFDDGEVTINVYTLAGQLVNSLYHAQTPQGVFTQYWDGKTGDGNLVASGVYFIYVKGPKVEERKKVVVIR